MYSWKCADLHPPRRIGGWSGYISTMSSRSCEASGRRATARQRADEVPAAPRSALRQSLSSMAVHATPARLTSSNRAYPVVTQDK